MSYYNTGFETGNFVLKCHLFAVLIFYARFTPWEVVVIGLTSCGVHCSAYYGMVNARVLFLKKRTETMSSTFFDLRDFFKLDSYISC